MSADEIDDAEGTGAEPPQSSQSGTDASPGKLYCPIRGPLKIGKKAKDGLTATEEKLRIDCIRFLLKKRYPKENFKVETTLLRFGNKGRNSFRTDLVVFDCPAADLQAFQIDKLKEHILLAGEIKRDNAEADEAKAMQVEPAMAFLPDSSALGVYWDDVEQRVFYFAQQGSKRKTMEAPISKLPDWGDDLHSTVLVYGDLAPAKSLLRTFSQIEDVLHSRVVDKSKRFIVLLQLLLSKLYDEQIHEKSNEPLDLQDFSISSVKDSNVKERMNLLLSKAVKFYGRYLPDKVSEKFAIDGSLLRRCTKLLAPLSILRSRRDVIQDFYMYFAKGLYKWELAQYFTPTEVVDCIVEVLNPQPGEHIKDPACGSSDFLISALRWAADRGWNASQSIWGVDNSSQAVQVSVLNMVLNGDGKSNIREEDSLESVQKDENQFRIMLCNPPFGTRIKEERTEVLGRFELGREWIRSGSGWKMSDQTVDSQETGLLFAELCIRQAEPGGRIGIVVPNGYLGNRNPRYTSFREWLLRNTRIVSIISLPRFTFKKSGADVSASLLFLEKREKPLTSLKKAGGYEFHVGLVTSVGWSLVKRPERLWVKDPQTGATVVDANNEPVPDATSAKSSAISCVPRHQISSPGYWRVAKLRPAHRGGRLIPRDLFRTPTSSSTRNG